MLGREEQQPAAGAPSGQAGSVAGADLDMDLDLKGDPEAPSGQTRSVSDGELLHPLWRRLREVGTGEELPSSAAAAAAAPGALEDAAASAALGVPFRGARTEAGDDAIVSADEVAASEVFVNPYSGLLSTQVGAVNRM